VDSQSKRGQQKPCPCCDGTGSVTEWDGEPLAWSLEHIANHIQHCEVHSIDGGRWAETWAKWRLTIGTDEWFACDDHLAWAMREAFEGPTIRFERIG